MFRGLYRQSGLFKVGVLSLAGALVLAVIVVILVRLPDEQAASAELAPETTTGPPETTEALSQPIQSSPLPEETEREQTEREQTEREGPERGQPEPERSEAREQPEPKQQDPGASAPAEPEKRSDQPSPPPEPRQERPEERTGGGLPAQVDDWPGAGGQEIEAAAEPRDYGWAQGAVMTLTSSALGVGGAPIFGDDSQRSLDQGIVHVPETSLPWDRGRQKNVYLAAHRLGWPGTGSRLIFYNLDKLQKGDKVSLEDRRGDTYRYRVTEKLVVDPLDSWVMGEVRNKDMLTLQTCTPIPTFHKRLIVRAERI